MHRRMGRLVAAVVAAAAVATGCGGPNPAGSAVIIGGEAVPLEAVQARMDVVLAKSDQLAMADRQGLTPADLARDVVTEQVLHDLLGRAAAEQGITVTEAQIDVKLADLGGAAAVQESSFYDEAALRERIRDYLTAAAVGRRAIGGLSVTADLIAATSRADAESKAAALVAGGPAAAALFAEAADGTTAQGQIFQAVTQPAEAATALFGTPVGSVAFFQPNQQRSTWIVFRVVERRTDVASSAEALNSISEDQFANVGFRLTQPVADEVGVEVNPRYGVWDPIQLRVVGADQITGAILAPAPAAER